MKQEIYNKVSQNIKQYILQYLDERDDCYLCDNKDRIIEKYINEICNENNSKMKSCTEKETEAYRKLMGVDNNGEKQTYKQACQELNKHNVKQLVFNANRKLMSTIYKEMLLEDKIQLIQLNYQYMENNGMILPEHIKIDDLSSIIYYEYQSLETSGIRTIKDMIEYSQIEIYNIILNTKTSRKSNKDTIANELINTIHILGFVFRDEEGYAEQEEYFEKLRSIIENPSKIYYDDEDIILKKEIYSRKHLINHLKKLLNQQENLTIEWHELEQEIGITKEKIIKAETNIRTRNKKHR